MSILTTRLKSIDNKTLHLVLTLFGVLLALQINYIQHGRINDDAVLYLEAARLFSMGEWTQAFSLYSWPLYSLLIAGTHQLLHLNLHLSAQLLNTVFFGIAAASFFKILLLAGGDRHVLLAGALILFSTDYIVGDILPMLIRDQGFWAFFLTSLVFFIRFIDSRALKHALLWQITTLIAMLFRIEAISYLIALPFVFFLSTQRSTDSRVRLFMKLYTLTIPVALSLLLLLISSEGGTKYIGRLNEVLTQNPFHQITHNFSIRSNVLRAEVLGEFLDDFATESLIVTLIFITIVKALSTPGWLVSILAAGQISFWKRSMKPEVAQVLVATLFITITNMFLIITKVFVLSGRYVVAAALIIIIFAAFSLAKGLKYLDSPDRKDRLTKGFVLLVLIVMTFGLIKNILPKRRGFNFEQEAVTWVKSHNPNHEAVYYDSARLRYYANAPYIGREQYLYWPHLKSIALNQELMTYRFLLVTLKQGDKEKETYLKNAFPQFHEVQRFWETRHRKSVVILSNEREIKLGKE